MFQGSLKVVSGKFQGCFFKGVLMVLRKFLGSFKGVSEKAHECFMKFTRKIER